MFPQNITAAQHVFFRLCALFMLTVSAIALMRAPFVSALVNREGYLYPASSDGHPLLVLALLLFVFWFLYRSEFRATEELRVDVFQSIMALHLVAIVVILAFYAMRPSPELTEWIHALRGRGPVYTASVTAVLYFFLLLPAPFFLPVLFPFLFLQRHARALLVIFGIALLYPFTMVLNAIWHAAVAEKMLTASAFPLSFLSDSVTTDPETLSLTYRGFTVIIGPICLGLSSVLLFLTFFGFLWMLLSGVKGFSHMRAVIACIAGIAVLLLLNLLRIILIMMVGASFPEMAVNLFHGSIGAIFFFIVFVAYLQWVVPWMKRGNGRGRS